MQSDLFGIYGASGFGCEVLPLARAMLMGASQQQWELVFIDDAPAAATLNGQRVLSYAEFLARPGRKHVNVAVAKSETRRALFGKCRVDGLQFFEVRAQNAVVLDDVEIGEGGIICPFVTITSNVRVGRGFHANIYSYVAHNCVIGDYVTFAPAVKCNGNVVVEDGAYLGAGCILRQGKPGAPLIIGAGATVGMGAVVTKSVPPGEVVMGNPARPRN